MALVVGLIVIVLVGAGVYLAYRRVLRRAKAIERSLKMVPLLIHLPPPSSDTETGNRDVREVMKEKIIQAEVLYDLLAGTSAGGFKSSFYGQRHIALELVSHKGIIHLYAAVPVNMVSVVSNAILTAYPGARIEEREDYNIFSPTGKLQGAAGGELVLKANSAYPIITPDRLERDPMEALMNAMSSLDSETGVGIQIMLRPAAKKWVGQAKTIVARKRRKGTHTSMQITGRDLFKAAVKGNDPEKEARVASLTTLEQQVLDAIENKTTKPGFEVLVRLVVSSDRQEKAQATLRNLATAFALFEAPGLNGFKFIPASDISGLATAYIMRYFPPELRSTILNSAELAMLYHVPDAQFSANSELQRQMSKQIDGPVNLPESGLLLGYNFFRGTKKEVRLSENDRRRHTYIVGQTGTGKSTLIENLAVQDMLMGNGFAFIDPHGDTAEKLLSLVPKSRAEDVIYFNPADMDYPLGLNLFEFQDDAQKDFLIQETINMLYKLYDPGKTGMIGPRFEHWFRNAALTLMSDPNGATFIEIPKVFSDAEFLKSKFRHLKDPTVIDFWTKEMGQTSDYHKSEMLGWFVSKFGAFMNNEMMRNILGQTQSAFNLRDVMDKKKILIVNLSKGQVGELNSQLLGMIFVMKFQAAAMSRAQVPEEQRQDFCLYVDEFQNFSTDSFATILSEARKYRLNLIVANQFIGQLSDQIRDAVFGNVGTIVSYRTGPEDAGFLVKQFAPVFDERDMVNLPNYNAAIRLMISGLPSQPFSITALPPLGSSNKELGAAIRQLSAAKFGINRQTVEARIFARLTAKPPVPAPSKEPLPVQQPMAQAVSSPAASRVPQAETATTAQQVKVPASIPTQPVRVAQDAVKPKSALPLAEHNQKMQSSHASAQTSNTPTAQVARMQPNIQADPSPVAATSVAANSSRQQVQTPIAGQHNAVTSPPLTQPAAPASAAPKPVAVNATTSTAQPQSAPQPQAPVNSSSVAAHQPTPSIVAQPVPLPVNKQPDSATVRASAESQQAGGVSPLKALERSLKAASEEALRHLEQAHPTPQTPQGPVPAPSPTQSAPAPQVVPQQPTRDLRANIGAVIMPAVTPRSQSQGYIQPASAPQAQVLKVQPNQSAVAPKGDNGSANVTIGKAQLAGSSAEHAPSKTTDPNKKPNQAESESVAQAKKEDASVSGGFAGEVFVDEDGNVHMS